MCLTKPEFLLFLETITASFSKMGESIVVVHATVGDVLWLWDGINFCTSLGVAS